MNPDRKLDIEIFNAALEIESPAERMPYVQEACAGNTERRQRIEALLKSYDASDSVFTDEPETRVAVSPQVSPLAEGPGTRIGPYKLLQQIGEGGMGVVYMAEQAEPVQRKVALKIIKIGMDTRQVVARFEAERQALAMMDHPNIAKVFDGGSTESGRPYFVMELVQGVPITEFCDKNKLSTQERIELFVPVCRAIQSAHHKGIIHRDIKPSNVLVTLHHGEPMPKVIDFGVAKAINQKLTEKTLFTNYAAMIGTPAYMSPEQAEMSSMDVDTRTDVYSLGVLLYELLTGTTPFDQKQLLSKGYGEMQRIIAEEEPQRPSLRASTMTAEKKTAAARSRRLEDSTLEAALRGDLDWITMKCLEKDRRRRYDTPTELVADLRRHLSDEPVGAAAPSMAYRFGKFYLRNRAVVRAAAAIVITLVAATAVSVAMAIRMSHLRKQANAAEKTARTQAAIAEAVNKFLNDDLLGQANPWNSPDSEVKLRTVVDRAAKAIEGKFKDQPLVEASIRATVGNIYAALDDRTVGSIHIDRAFEIYERELGGEHPETIKLRLRRGNNLTWESDQDKSKYEEACRETADAFALCRRVLGMTNEITLEAMRNHIYALGRGRRKEERALLEEALPLHESVYGVNDTHAVNLLINLAANYREHSSQFEKEAELAREAVRRSEWLPPDHPDRFRSRLMLAGSRGFKGTSAERRQMVQESYETALRAFGPVHWLTIGALQQRAFVAATPQESHDLFNEAYQATLAHWGADDTRTLQAQVYLGETAVVVGQADKVEELLLSGLRKLEHKLEQGKIDKRAILYVQYHWRIGIFYIRRNELEKAETFLKEAVKLAEQIDDGQGSHLQVAATALREVYARRNQYREAADVNRRFLEKRRSTFGIRNARTIEHLENYLHQLDFINKTDEADDLISAAIDAFIENGPENDDEWESVRHVVNAIGHSVNKDRFLPVVRRMFEPVPSTLSGLVTLELFHWVSGDWSGWYDVSRAKTLIEPQEYSHWYQRSAAAVEIGKIEEHVVACRGLLARCAGQTTDISLVRRTLKACFVVAIDWPAAELEKLESFYRRLDAESGTVNAGSRTFHAACLALADFRLGRLESALRQLAEAGIVGLESSAMAQGNAAATQSEGPVMAMGTSQALVVAALCHAKSGDYSAAVEDLRRADAVIQHLRQCQISPVDFCTRKYLYAEARDLIERGSHAQSRTRAP